MASLGGKAKVQMVLLLLLLILLIPYLASAILGQAEAGLTGLAALHGAAESVYCGDGLTPAGIILFLEIALLLLLTLFAKQRQKPFWNSLRHNGGYLLGFAVLVAVPFFIAWQTESSVCVRGKAFFWESIFIELFILAILAISYNLLFGFTGVVSFGHAAFFGLGAYSVGLLISHWGWPWWAAVLGGLGVGILVALIKGFVGLRIKGLYFALFTLAFAEVFFILAGNRIMVNLTGAEDGFTFAVPDFLNITRNRLFFYYLALLILVGCFALVYRLMQSPTGRIMTALRDNENRAQMLGYNTFYFKLLAIILSGTMASLAGILRGLALKGASPNVLSLDFTITPLLMTIIGGTATFVGPLIGAFGLRLIEELLRDTVLTIGSSQINIGERWSLILGLVFILSVMVFPYGIVGTWQKWWYGRHKKADVT